MSTLIALTVFAVAGLFIFLTLALIGFVIKAILWMVFFPLRLVFKLLFWILGAGLAVVFLPILLVIVAVVVIGGILAALLSMLAPLLPVAIVALVGWGIYRASTRRPSPVI
jgi:hypothetical protein